MRVSCTMNNMAKQANVCKNCARNSTPGFFDTTSCVEHNDIKSLEIFDKFVTWDDFFVYHAKVEQSTKDLK